MHQFREYRQQIIAEQDKKVSHHSKRLMKGALEVRAKVDSPRGLSANKIPAGEVGYVQTMLPNKSWYVHWPHIKSDGPGDSKNSAHPRDHLEPTGKRG